MEKIKPVVHNTVRLRRPEDAVHSLIRENDYGCRVVEPHAHPGRLHSKLKFLFAAMQSLGRQHGKRAHGLDVFRLNDVNSPRHRFALG